MGTASSRFRNALLQGDENAAKRVLRESGVHWLDPNASYGEKHQENTPLHLAARHAMPDILLWLVTIGGDPTKRNSAGQTVLHLICSLSPEGILSTEDKKRSALVERLLDGTQAFALRVDVEDGKGNTPLHFSAASGLHSVSRLLMNRGAPIFAKDSTGRTACDCAVERGHGRVSSLLESAMVFSGVDSSALGMSEARAELMLGEESAYRGLRAQQVVEAKDYLLIDIADMLQIPLFAAQALLRRSSWSRTALLDEWMRDKDGLCRAAGLPDLKSGAREELSFSARSAASQTHSSLAGPTEPPSEVECDICLDTMRPGEAPEMPCEHRFCKDCWRTFLDGKIRDGTTQMLECPASDCNGRVPAEVVDLLMPANTRRRYDDFDMKSFVDSNPNMRFCTAAKCDRIVELQSSAGPDVGESAAAAFAPAGEASGRMVDCGEGHFFCWDCGARAHEPCPCDRWEEWKKKVSEANPTACTGLNGEAESAANRVWMLCNSKPCPKCQVRIERSEGCNHMRCTTCSYDFCWMCREPWNLHSSATGGYYRCNRFEAVNKFEEGVDKELSEAEDRHSKLLEQKRFAHFYSRFTAHEECIAIIEPLLNRAEGKLRELGRLTSQCNRAAEQDTSFLGEALWQLLAARHVLRASYAFGYFLDDPELESNPRFTVFNSYQGQLEEATEKLSAMIARKSLQTPRSHIIEAAVALRHRRGEFVSSVQHGLLPKGLDTRELVGESHRQRSKKHHRHRRRRRSSPPLPRLPFFLHGSLVDGDDDDDNDYYDGRVAEEAVSAICQRTDCMNPCTRRYPNYCSRACAQMDEDNDESRIEQLLRTTMLLSQLEALRDSRLQEEQRHRMPAVLPLPVRQRALPTSPHHRDGGSPIPSAGAELSDEEAVLRRALALSQQEASTPVTHRLDSEDDEELARAISLSLMEAPPHHV